VPLWPETTDAIKAAIAKRCEPKDETAKKLIFIGARGESYVCSNGYRVCQEFVRGLALAKVTRRGFYCLRHVFQTIGEGAHDLAAVQSLMGHAPASNDMNAAYRERVDDARLKAVTDHVRKWLFSEKTEGE
jgi:integrase